MRLYVPRDPGAIREYVRYAELDHMGRPLPVHAREGRLRRLIEDGESVLATQDRLTISILSYFLRLGVYDGLIVEVWEQLPGGEWECCDLGPDGFLTPLFQKVPSHHSLMDAIASYRTAMRPLDLPEPDRPALPETWDELIHYQPPVAV